jgi:hypothetical protein
VLSQACSQFAADKTAPDTCVRCRWPINAHHGAVAPAPRLRTMRGWADTICQETCRATRCGKPIWFIQNIKTGARMPFDGRPSPIAVEQEIDTGRVIWLLDLAKSHMATCVSTGQFRRRR